MDTTQPIMSLRELAKQYARGRIDRPTYRQRRRRLLNELATYVPPTLPQSSAIPTPQSKLAQKTEVKGRGLLWGLLVGLMVLLIGVLWLFFWRTDESNDLPETSIQPAESGPIKPPAPQSNPKPASASLTNQPENNLIKDFLTVNDWSTESRLRLLQLWASLSQETQEAIKSSTWFLTFSSELHTMIKVERGLAGTEPSPMVDSLLTFAARFGLDFNLPKFPLAPTNSPVSPHEKKSKKSQAKIKKENYLPKQSKPEADLTKIEIVAGKRLAQAAQTEANLPVQPRGSLQQKVERIVAQQPIAAKNPTTARDNSCRPVIRRAIFPKCRDRLKNGSKGPWLHLLPGGRFTMGTEEIQSASPPHRVEIAYPLAIGTYEVSYKEFSSFCHAEGIVCPDQPWQNAALPVVNVSRTLAEEYAQWLSKQTRHGYRLPTEAEWEYAARAGTVTPYPLPERDLGTYAHYSRRERKTSPLPPKPQRTNPNQFGIFNMAGNVREWVLDSWLANYRQTPNDGSPRQNKQESLGIVRGGSYADDKGPLRSYARQKLPRDVQDVFTGFRLVRDIYLKPQQDDLSLWGDWWLGFQPDELYTVQLMTHKALTKVREIIAEYPQLPLKVVSSNQPEGAYLLLYGLFDSLSSATDASRTLPLALDESADLVVKTIAELR